MVYQVTETVLPLTEISSKEGSSSRLSEDKPVSNSVSVQHRHQAPANNHISARYSTPNQLQKLFETEFLTYPTLLAIPQLSRDQHSSLWLLKACRVHLPFIYPSSKVQSVPRFTTHKQEAENSTVGFWAGETFFHIAVKI